jgi:hypothetical protein
MHLNDILSNPLLSATAAYFGGGKPPSAPKQDFKLPPMQSANLQIPPPPPPVKPPPPPPTESNMESERAGQQAAKDAKRKSSMGKSILAGETGGYRSSATGSSVLG